MFPRLEDIKKRRKQLNLTQGQLAKLAKVAPSTITKIERRNMSPSYDIVVKIFNALEKKELEGSKNLLANNIHNRNIVGINRNNSVKKARDIMEKYSFSQIPVYDGKQIIGSITDRTLATYISSGKDYNLILHMKAEDFMGPSFPKVDENTPVEIVGSLLNNSYAVITMNKGEPVGIISRADLAKVITK